MKVLTLLGSARKKGNTATTLTLVEEELTSMGHEIERITLHDKDIKGCMGCRKCHETPEEIACVQNDDANEILEKIIEADAVLLTSPIYFWGFTAQLKSLIDRSFAFVTQYHQPGHDSLVKGKRMGLLTTGGGAYEDNAEGTFFSYKKLVNFLMTDNKAAVHIGKCTIPTDLPEETAQQAKELAKSLIS